MTWMTENLHQHVKRVLVFQCDYSKHSVFGPFFGLNTSLKYNKFAQLLRVIPKSQKLQVYDKGQVFETAL